MANASLTEASAGHFILNGELSFATVVGLLERGRTAFAGQREVEVELSGVTHADSAGLALLLEWLRLARLQGQKLVYKSVPKQLHTLANISEVAEWLA
jgi:phospholipid transport system transporter-binding protein